MSKNSLILDVFQHIDEVCNLKKILINNFMFKMKVLNCLLYTHTHTHNLKILFIHLRIKRERESLSRWERQRVRENQTSH